MLIKVFTISLTLFFEKSTDFTRFADQKSKHENIKHDIYQARPEFFNPEQEGSEKYNQGWNEAISCYQSSINQFLDYYISELKGEDNNHNYIGEDEK